MHRSLREQIFTGLDWAFRLLLAGVLLYAAWPKMLDPHSFAKAIANYKVSLPIVGSDYIFLTAIILPPLEAVTAICLFVNRMRRGAALMAVILMSLFIVLIAQAVLRGFNIDCGCFGASASSAALASKVGWSKVGENAGLLVAALFVYLRACPPKPKYRL